MGRALLFPRAGVGFGWLPLSFCLVSEANYVSMRRIFRLQKPMKHWILSLLLLVSLFQPLSGEQDASKTESRDTTTGKNFESQVKAALEELDYEVKEQVQIGTRPNGRRHMVDLVVSKGNRSVLISLKWQQSSGTAEQKVPYELICLSEALKQSRGAHKSAYLVLGGEGWTLKKFYLSGGLDRHLNLDQPVKLLDWKSLLKLAAKNEL